MGKISQTKIEEIQSLLKEGYLQKGVAGLADRPLS